MPTISLKLPPALLLELESEATTRGVIPLLMPPGLRDDVGLG
jgi:hypothetical protein